MSYGQGIIYSGPDFASGVPRGANNGLSIDGITGFSVLGQDHLDPLNPAILLNSRQIPMNGNNIFLTGQDDGSGNLDSIIFENGGIVSIRRNSSVTTGPSLNFHDYDDGSDANITYSDLQWRFSAGPFIPMEWQMGSVLLSLTDDTGVIPFNAAFATYISGLGGHAGMNLAMSFDNVAGVPDVFGIELTDVASDPTAKLANWKTNTITQFSVDKAGNIINNGTIQTANPGSGLGKIKMGSIVNAAVAIDPNNYWEIESNGVVKKVLIAL